MKTAMLFIFGGVVLVLGLFFIASELRRIRRDRKNRRELKRQEETRRQEIKGGVASEDAFKRQIAFQAAVLHANSQFAEALATVCLGILCILFSALIHVVGLWLKEPLTWVLEMEFLVVGAVIVAVSFADLIDFKFFQRDLSSEYRALIDIEESSADKD